MHLALLGLYYGNRSGLFPGIFRSEFLWTGYHDRSGALLGLVIQEWMDPLKAVPGVSLPEVQSENRTCCKIRTPPVLLYHTGYNRCQVPFQVLVWEQVTEPARTPGDFPQSFLPTGKILSVVEEIPEVRSARRVVVPPYSVPLVGSRCPG